MKIKNLKIKFFRGIYDLTLDFSTDQPIVFIGNNGVGKSTILDCLAVFLSRLMMAVRTPRGVLPPTITEKDITNGYNETINETTISVDQLGDLPLTFILDRRTFAEDSQGESDELNVFHSFVYGQFKANPKASLPLAVYYPTNRTVYDSISLENIKEDSFCQLDAYDGAIVAGKTDFTDLFMWFKKVEDLENELRLDNNPDYRDRKLEAVRQAIYSLIPEFSDLRIRRSPLRMTVKKQDREFIINQLSDGEKCLLA
ncbi:MAG: AAA family ATPase, partial [Phormidium sp.]